jgi:benzylsuccinate CoA-transferase BbsF subunit
MSNPAALSKYRMLDFSWVLAGPYASALLADMGMEVIKVESRKRPDTVRNYPPPYPSPINIDESGYWNLHNRSKKGIALNMKTKKARDIAGELVQQCDVVVENFSARVMKSFGLDYAKMSELNPKIIYCSMAGFGHTGPYRTYISYGGAIEAASGLISLSGYPDHPPVKSGVTYADYVGGAHAAFSILAALYHREKTGQGQHIELGQLDTAVSMLDTAVLDYKTNGNIQKPMGNYHPAFHPHNVYPCRGTDRWVAIVCETEGSWERLCTLMGTLDLVKDKRFCTNEARMGNREALDSLISSWTIRYEPLELQELLQKGGVQAGAVMNIAEVVESPHLKERGYIENWDHPVVGDKRYHRAPIVMSETPVRIRKRAPLLGEDTESVLCGMLGYSKEQLVQLVEEEVLY